jgi:DUF4097 and DUF4098 domain-containing protein YvlB
VLEHTLGPGSILDASTTSGSIEVTGQETDGVHVVATIVARAATKENARNLAEQVSIQFEQTADGLGIKVDSPDLASLRFVSISYKIIVPRQTEIDCASASGAIDLADLIGDVNARAASGSIKAAGITGSVHLHSSSGSVSCDQIDRGDVYLESMSGGVHFTDGSTLGICQMGTASGSVTGRHIEANSIRLSSASSGVTLSDAQADVINLHSSSGLLTAKEISCERLQADSTSGRVSIAFAPDAPGDVAAGVKSGSGSVSVAMPRDFAGHVNLRASSGTVRMSQPVTVVGKPAKNHVSGTIGSGSGTLLVRAGSGAIRVR